jgi:hypothetical protein
VSVGRRRLDREQIDVGVRDERQGDPAEVRPAAAGADDDVRQPFAGQLELLLGFEADDGLVEQDVVEDGAERVVRVRPAGRVADRVADRRAERPGVVRVVDRRRHDLAAPDLHHRPPVRLLLVRRPDHVDLAFEAEQRRGERQRAPPLAGAGLRRQSGDAVLLVVERLGHRGVRLVRSGRRDRLVLVVDTGRRSERPFEPLGPDERRRAPQPQDVEHLAGHVDPRRRRDLLTDERHREERRQVVRADRLPRCRVQRRLQRLGQVRGDVEPGRGYAVGGELPAHVWPPFVAGTIPRVDLLTKSSLRGYRSFG